MTHSSNTRMICPLVQDGRFDGCDTHAEIQIFRLKMGLQRCILSGIGKQVQIRMTHRVIVFDVVQGLKFDPKSLQRMAKGGHISPQLRHESGRTHRGSETQSPIPRQRNQWRTKGKSVRSPITDHDQRRAWLNVPRQDCRSNACSLVRKSARAQSGKHHSSARSRGQCLTSVRRHRQNHRSHGGRQRTSGSTESVGEA